jgi:PEP-CTERM motif
MTRLLWVAIAGAFVGFSGVSASAAIVSFTGNGTFSNITNCGGGFPGCSVTGGGNVLDMSGGNNSTLTITDVSNSVSTNTNDTEIGRITWVNRPSTRTDQNFNVRYTYALSFTSPSVTSDSQIFNLNITQPTNPPGDNVFNISNLTLSGLGPFTLAGVNVSDIKFSLLGATGAYNGTDWTNPEGGISTLRLTADFTAAVPEPSTWAMMIIGFAGLALAQSRRRRQTFAAV